MDESRSTPTLMQFIRLSRPLLLLGVILVYWLGAGIADYLGTTINWGDYTIGQFWVIAIQLGGIYLREYFNRLLEPKNTRQNSPPKRNQDTGPSDPHFYLLVAAAACLTAAASLSVFLLRGAHLSPQALLLMGLGFLGVVAYSVPPVRLDTSGYGELVATILIANLTPAFAFTLQTGELHRLLAMTTFPLSALCMASFLVYELSNYAEDVKKNRRLLLVRMGWQRGMLLHNAMLLVAYLLIALALTFGLPLFIGLPALLPLPLSVLQIWQMRRIADGAKPNWNSLKLTALVLFATTAYLLGFAFWMR